jgi:hypothetical protein
MQSMMRNRVDMMRGYMRKDSGYNTGYHKPRATTSEHHHLCHWCYHGFGDGLCIPLVARVSFWVNESASDNLDQSIGLFTVAIFSYFLIYFLAPF